SGASSQLVPSLAPTRSPTLPATLSRTLPGSSEETTALVTSSNAVRRRRSRLSLCTPLRDSRRVEGREAGVRPVFREASLTNPPGKKSRGPQGPSRKIGRMGGALERKLRGGSAARVREGREGRS